MKLGIQPSVEVDPDDVKGADLGALLRASRLRRGDDLRQVANILRIRYVYLEAIEEGRFDVLPGTTYTNGFIRTYSDYLGLDGEEIVRRLSVEGVVSTVETELRFPTIIPDHGIPGSAIVMVGLFIALLGYGSWYLTSARDVVVSNVEPPVSKILMESGQTDATKLAPVVQNTLVEPSSASAASAKSPIEIAKNVENYKKQTAREFIAPEKTQEVLPSAKTASLSEKLTGVTAPLVNRKHEPITEYIPSVQPNHKFRYQENKKVKNETSRALHPDNKNANGAPTFLARSNSEPFRYPADIENAEVTRATGEVQIKVVNAEDKIPVVVTEPSLVQAALDDSAPDTLSKLPNRTDNEVVSVPDASTGPNLPGKTNEEVASVPDTEAGFNLPNLTEKEVKSAPNTELGSSLPDSIDEEVASIPGTGESALQSENNTNSQNPSTLKSGTLQGPRITLVAKDASWIQVRDINANELILSKVLLKGHSYQVPNRQGLSLMTGNAGAIEISVNGEIVPAIGNLGEVRQKVLLEAERLRQGRAVIE